MSVCDICISMQCEHAHLMNNTSQKCTRCISSVKDTIAATTLNRKIYIKCFKTYLLRACMSVWMSVYMYQHKYVSLHFYRIFPMPFKSRSIKYSSLSYCQIRKHMYKIYKTHNQKQFCFLSFD